MTAILAPPLIFQGLSAQGVPLAGGLLASYIAGTTTPQATYVDSTQGTPNTNPIVLNASGQCALWLDPAKVYKFVLTDVVSNQLYVTDQVQGSLTAAALSTALLAPFLNLQQTPAEAAAGVVPVNLAYPPGYVDRYVTNTIPGTTDMSAAFNAAIKQAKKQGVDIRWGATAPYATTNPVNATSSLTDRQYGMVFRCENGPEMGNFAPGPSIIANHTGHVFDLTGTIGAVFENVAIATGASTPQTAFFQARLQPAGGPGFVGPSCGISRFNNCSTLGVFTKAAYYNFGAEDDQLNGCYFNNSYAGAGGKVNIYTANNILGLTSTFQTVASGIAQSSVDHKIFGGEIYMQSHDAAADCISIEQADSLKIYGPWMFAGDATAGGRSLIHMDLTNAASNYCMLDGITGENAVGFMQAYSVHVDNAPSGANQYIPVNWTIKGCKFPNGTAALATAGTNTVLDSWTWVGNAVPQNGISIPGILRNSFFDFGIGLTTFTIGTSSKNCLMGDTAVLAITTRSSDNWIDMGVTNKTIATVTTSGGITSSAGALIARARLSLTGPCLTFNILLASTSGNLAITAGSTVTLTAPGGQSLSPNDVCSCTVVDQTSGVINGASYTASGANGLITIPVAVVATPHSIIVSGTIFLA